MIKRIFIIINLFAFSLLFQVNTSYAAKNQAAINQMKTIANALRNAQNVGTRSAFRNVIRRYADVGLIARYSLGRYKSKLKKSLRSNYYDGTVYFLARYLSNQSRKYKVMTTTINSNLIQKGKDFIIKTKVRLTSGSTYSVDWQLSKRGRKYKVTDVTVHVLIAKLSATYWLRGLFTTHLRQQNGSIEQLIAALKRHY